MALFGTNEIDSLGFFGGAPINYTTTNRYYTGGGRRGAPAPARSSAAYLFPPDFGPYNDFWLHFGWFHENNYGGRVVELYDNSGVNVARLYGNFAGSYRLEYWDGAAYQTGTAYAALQTDFTLTTYDIRVQVSGGNITLSLWQDNSKVDEQTYPYAGNGVARWRAYGLGSNSFQEQSYTEFIWGDQSTILHRVLSGTPTAEGFHTDGDSDHTTVDEGVTPNDGDLNSLSAAGDRQSFVHGALAVPAGLEVKSVCIGARVQKTGAGPQNVEAFLRISGTDYDHGSNFADIDFSPAPYLADWQQNPATVAKWTNSEAVDVAMEFGIEAVA